MLCEEWTKKWTDCILISCGSISSKRDEIKWAFELEFEIFKSVFQLYSPKWSRSIFVWLNHQSFVYNFHLIFFSLFTKHQFETQTVYWIWKKRSVEFLKYNSEKNEHGHESGKCKLSSTLSRPVTYYRYIFISLELVWISGVHKHTHTYEHQLKHQSEADAWNLKQFVLYMKGEKSQIIGVYDYLILKKIFWPLLPVGNFPCIWFAYWLEINFFSGGSKTLQCIHIERVASGGAFSQCFYFVSNPNQMFSIS